MGRYQSGRGGRSYGPVPLLGLALTQLLGGCLAEPAPAEAEGPETAEIAQPAVGAQGIGAQGIGAQGIGAQGIGAQGTFSGAAINGKIPPGYQLGKALQTSPGHWPTISRWFFPLATALVNSATQLAITPSASSPFFFPGVVRPSPGAPFAGVSGDTVSLRIVAMRSADATSNLFALPPANPYAWPDSRSNADVTLYKVEWLNGASWQPVCPLGGEGVAGQIDATGAGWAMFVRGTYDAKATASELTTNKSLVPGPGAEFTLACTNGAIAKCARQWGYKPWKSAPDWFAGDERDLRPYHQMCLRAARADYCSDGSSLTRDGTLVDLADTRGFVQRESENSDASLFVGESVFTVSAGSGSPEGRAWCLQKTRYDELTSAGSCTPQLATHLSSCLPYYGGSYALTRDLSHLTWDAVWAGTKTYCPHKTSETGAALGFDCNYCTRRVCDPGSAESNIGAAFSSPPGPGVGDGYCCENAWDSICVSEAAAWCAPSALSNRAEFTAWKVGGPPTLEPDWYAPQGPTGAPRWDFTGRMKDYGPLGTAPFGTPAGFPSNSGARWVGAYDATQVNDYFRYRFPGWKTGTVTVYVAAYDEFSVYLDGVLLGSGSAPGVTKTFTASTVAGKEHLVALATKKPGGGGVFALDIRLFHARWGSPRRHRRRLVQRSGRDRERRPLEGRSLLRSH